MTGGEQVAVWLFGILCALLAVCAAVKAWQETRIAQAEAAKRIAEAQANPFFAPDWSRDGGL